MAGAKDTLPFEELLEVGGFLPSFLDKGRWQPVTRLQELVLSTLARGRSTYETILELLASGRSLQAAMLSRSLFEDMVVAHWLELNHDDPDWLIDRFDRHRDAMRLHDARIRRAFGFDERPGEELLELQARETELINEFGRHAQRDWWGVTPDGKPMRMPQLVETLAAAPLFHPRLRGEAPILEQYYAMQQKSWTQALHHTAAGMQLGVRVDDSFPAATVQTPPFLILFGNYWVFGQLIFTALELATAPDVIARFEKQFLSGLAVLGSAVDVHAPWMERVEGWAREAESTQPAKVNRRRRGWPIRRSAR
jgi:hypothetical protein